jgi:hypothetical protein
MSTHLTCPGCGRVLILPGGCTAEVLSCPRCLAHLDNPQTAARSADVQTETPPARSSITPERLPFVADVDVEVRRDKRGTSVLMILLAALGSIGVAYALLGSFVMLREGEFLPLFCVLGVAVVLTLISAAWVATHEPGETPAANIGRTVLGVLTISGVIIGVGTLLVVAGLILLFAVCLSNGGKC